MQQARFFLTLVFSLIIALHTNGQARKKEFYFSWGYNAEWYTRSTIKVSQPALGSKYKLNDIQGHDLPGWNSNLTKKPLTIPQYNYRLGLFINRKKGIAIEINFDHTKFIFAEQAAHITGTINNRQVDTTANFNAYTQSYYYLNNGANFLLFNIVKRWHWYEAKKIKIDLLGKAGIGPVIPHVENAFFVKKNDKGFQLGGWNIGVEAAVRATFFNLVYLEYCNKLDYARYSNLKVYQGRAKHAFGTYEMILNLGFSFPVGGKLKPENKIK